MSKMKTTQPKMFRVVEVPVGATAEQTEEILNAPYAEGYYFLHQVAAEGAALRAIYKLRTRPEKGKR
jgi:hypothetical protein